MTHEGMLKLGYIHRSGHSAYNRQELLVLGTKQMLRNLPQISIKVGTSTVTESRTVRNLGLVTDKHLTFQPHIDQLTAKSTGALIALMHARHLLPRCVLKQIVEGRGGELGVLRVREHPLNVEVHPLTAKSTPSI